MKLTYLIITLFTTFALAAFPGIAETNFIEQNILNSDSDKYEILKKLFDESKTPADLSDFDFHGETPKKACLVVSEKARNAIIINNIVRIVKVIEPSGPLFPGGSETKIITYGDLAGYSPLTFFESISLSKSESELIYEMSERSDVTGTPVFMKLRRSGEYIAYFYSIYHGTENALQGYGYCYSTQK